MSGSSSRRTLYPEIDAYDEGMLTVDEEVPHRLWYGLYGKSESEKTALFLHGGPGGGCSPGNARLFDPNEYRVVLFDQRGAGKSTPNGSLERNTTWHLVEDIEKCVESSLRYVSLSGSAIRSRIQWRAPPRGILFQASTSSRSGQVACRAGRILGKHARNDLRYQTPSPCPQSCAAWRLFIR